MVRMMSAETEKLVLENLRAIREDISDLREAVHDLRNRQNDTHALLLSLKRQPTSQSV